MFLSNFFCRQYLVPLCVFMCCRRFHWGGFYERERERKGKRNYAGCRGKEGEGNSGMGIVGTARCRIGKNWPQPGRKRGGEDRQGGEGGEGGVRRPQRGRMTARAKSLPVVVHGRTCTIATTQQARTTIYRSTFFSLLQLTSDR